MEAEDVTGPRAARPGPSACPMLHERVDPTLSLELERIDVRPDKGMVNFVFVDHDWGVQLDGATGELLHVERRRSDFIENLHDGSILDLLGGTRGDPLKLACTTILGTSLRTFVLSGLWLWRGPVALRRLRGRAPALRQHAEQGFPDGARAEAGQEP